MPKIERDLDIQFGEHVLQEARRLESLGHDPNQIAGTLCEGDAAGANFGIGIVLDSEGVPFRGSVAILRHAAHELDRCQVGRYMNSDSRSGILLERVLAFQRIPNQYWKQFSIALPSDSGTGAVRLGLEFVLATSRSISQLAVEEMGWPAYKSMAAALRLGFSEFESTDVPLPGASAVVYQAGPLNTTGLVRTLEVTENRATDAAKHGRTVVLDRAYPGFEFAGQIVDHSYDSIMRRSYELQIEPFIKNGVPFFVALSPTKSFISFAMRPCGLLLAFTPQEREVEKTTTLLNTLMRARGSSSEHPLSRAFVSALIESSAELEREHEAVLRRVAEAEALWRRLATGTAIARLYGAEYAGIFRNPRLRDGGACRLYARHIYPVIAGHYCRHNVTGISGDPDIARQQVAAFAEECGE